MDLPGRTEKDVNLEMDHNVLTILPARRKIQRKILLRRKTKARGFSANATRTIQPALYAAG